MTRIYGTLGPACEKAETLEQMLRLGMTGLRLNLSHVSLEQAAGELEELRRAEERRGKPLAERVRVLYSRVIRGAEYGSGEWKVLGTIPRLEGDTAQKLKHIAGEAAFDGLMKG